MSDLAVRILERFVKASGFEGRVHWSSPKSEERAPLDETLIARPSIHRVTFETNRSTGEWRARCSCCGWADTRPDKEQIGSVAARHDFQEMTPPADKRPRQSVFGEILQGFAEQQRKFRERENQNNRTEGANDE